MQWIKDSKYTNVWYTAKKFGKYQYNVIVIPEQTDKSIKYWISVLSFLRENKISKEQMEDDLNMELDLSGSYDFRMSETEKIKNYIMLYEKEI